MVDSNDPERMKEAGDELHRMVRTKCRLRGWRDAFSHVCLRKNDVELLLSFQLEEDELRGVALLVFANKQDLPRAMSVGDVAEALRLSGVSQPVGGGLGSAQVGECFLPESLQSHMANMMLWFCGSGDRGLNCI